MSEAVAGNKRRPPLLLLCVCFGIATGFFEVAHQLSRKVFLGLILKQPDHLLWMAPVAYLLVFLGFGLLLLPLIRLWPRLFQLRTVVFLLVFFAAWTQFRLYPWLHDSAIIILSAGLALQVARIANKRADAQRVKQTQAVAPSPLTILPPAER